MAICLSNQEVLNFKLSNNGFELSNKMKSEEDISIVSLAFIGLRNKFLVL